jgi:hypothetical protein
LLLLSISHHSLLAQADAQHLTWNIYASGNALKFIINYIIINL